MMHLLAAEDPTVAIPLSLFLSVVGAQTAAIVILWRRDTSRADSDRRLLLNALKADEDEE